MMTKTECEAILAYMDALVSVAHADRDVTDAMDNGWGTHVADAERVREDASDHMDRCFDALPQEMLDAIDAQRELMQPHFPSTPAPMPPHMNVDTWAEMTPDERWDFDFHHYPQLCPQDCDPWGHLGA